MIIRNLMFFFVSLRNRYKCYFCKKYSQDTERGSRNSVELAGLLAQVMVSQYEVDHGFNHGNSPWKHAGVMPTFGAEGGRFSVSGDRFLFMVDGCGGLEGNSKVDLFSIGDPSLDSSRTVGTGLYISIFDHIFVIVL